jgi:hypothetical protein
VTLQTRPGTLIVVRSLGNYVEHRKHGKIVRRCVGPVSGGAQVAAIVSGVSVVTGRRSGDYRVYMKIAPWDATYVRRP